MTTRKRILLAPVLVLALMAAACSDNALQAVSRGLVDIAAATGTLQTTVIAGNRSGVISDDDTGAILTVCAQINSAGQQASALTRNLTSLPAPQKSQVLAILTPVMASVSNAVTNGTARIKNPSTQATVVGALAAIQTSLVTIQAALGGK